VSPTRCGAGIACFGPSKDAARIEGSKAFAKDVMAAAGVRTATSETVDNPAHLDAALNRFGPPAGQRAWVVKDDGLAAGKGVVVTTDRDAARAHAAELLETGHPVLLESFLDGPEVSLFCVVDGETVLPLLPRTSSASGTGHRAQHRGDGRLCATALAAR
jgi:phosphoribosylamine--glycine ligase